MTFGERIVKLSRTQRALLELRLSALTAQSDERLIQPAAAEGTLASSGHVLVSPATPQHPTMVSSTAPAKPLEKWLRANKGWLSEQLLDSGAVLFRGFEVSGAVDFERCIQNAFEATTDYPGLAQGVVLREQIHGKIYTSTEYSSAFQILQHNECSFAHAWPAQICFYCIEPPATGGETPIADTRQILASVSETTRKRLEQTGVLYVRNFGYGTARSWQKTFATDDKRKVETLCQAEGVSCEWLDDAHLRTSARRPALTTHPTTGEPLWFNHIHASHISSLEPALRDTLLSEFGSEGLPRNCYYGDGTAIEQKVIEEIQAAVAKHVKTFKWQSGDVLMLDNMLCSHGRNPFTGSRKIAVGMAGSIAR